jgi:hypothetical protein
MVRKKFEELEYDPIESEAKRQLARTVSVPSKPPHVVPVSQTSEAEKTDHSPFNEPTIVRASQIETGPSHVTNPSELGDKGAGAKVALNRKEKKRSFSCASQEQDTELDSFVLRIQEVAGTHVPFQVLMRAACMAMLSAEDQLVTEIKKTNAPSFPAKFAHAKYAEFEEYWSQVIQKAIRRSRTFGS